MPNVAFREAAPAPHSASARRGGAGRRAAALLLPSGAGPGALPAPLRDGVLALSGLDLGAVRVHGNSPRPAQLKALAYTQGDDIYLGPGQESHLPHEAWHVVQQRQGRVAATLQAYGARINDDPALESEADLRGAEVLRAGTGAGAGGRMPVQGTAAAPAWQGVVQRAVGFELEVAAWMLAPTES